MPSRAADISVRANNRKLRGDLKKSEKELRGFGVRAGKSLGGAFRASLGGLAALGTAGGLASIGQEVMDFERGFTRLSIQAGEGFDASRFRDAFGEISEASGQSKASVLGMANAIVNLEGASGLTIDKLNLLTSASVATGASMDDMAGIAFAMRNAFDITEVEEMERALSGVIEAGKQGSVPLNEMNAILQQQAATFARISSTGAKGVIEFAAAVQVARKGFGSAAETGTGIKAFVSQLDTAAPKLKAFGVRVFKVGKDGKKSLRPMTEIMDQLGRSKLVKDPAMLARVFGSEEARKFLRVMIKGRDEFDNIVASGEQSNAVQEDKAKFLESTAGRMDKALIAIKAKFAEAFTPERIESLVEAGETLAEVLGFAIDNIELFIAAWAAWKALQVGRWLITAANAASELGDNVGKVSGGMKGASKSARALQKAGNFGGMASSLTAVFVAGLAVGRVLDEVLDLSGKISDVAIGVTGGVSSVRERTEALKMESQAKERALASPGLQGKSEAEIADIRAQSLELSRAAGERRTQEQAAAANPELAAAMAAMLDRIPDKVAEGLASSAVTVDGATVKMATNNAPSNRRSQPR